MQLLTDTTSFQQPQSSLNRIVVNCPPHYLRPSSTEAPLEAPIHGSQATVSEQTKPITLTSHHHHHHIDHYAKVADVGGTSLRQQLEIAMNCTIVPCATHMIGSGSASVGSHATAKDAPLCCATDGDERAYSFCTVRWIIYPFLFFNCQINLTFGTNAIEGWSGKGVGEDLKWVITSWQYFKDFNNYICKQV